MKIRNDGLPFPKGMEWGFDLMLDMTVMHIETRQRIAAIAEEYKLPERDLLSIFSEVLTDELNKFTEEKNISNEVTIGALKKAKQGDDAAIKAVIDLLKIHDNASENLK